MEPQESLKEFSIRFVHSFFEFPERDVDWAYLIEQFRQVVFISLEHLQSATKPNPNVCYDNSQVSSCPDCVPNISLSVMIILKSLVVWILSLTFPCSSPQVWDKFRPPRRKLLFVTFLFLVLNCHIMDFWLQKFWVTIDAYRKIKPIVSPLNLSHTLSNQKWKTKFT